MSADILVKVDSVSKKFCRSLKKSLWYGVSDIFSDLSSFARKTETGKRQTEGRNEEVADITKFPLSQFPISALSADLRPGEFWAVNDVSFELKRGECLGLIGRNGAGKTTLLKMLNGLIKPDGGRIEMRGRVGALIALGAGFNPILTGRENIYVNGSVLGLTKREINGKMEDIIDFADIGDFVDTPVQSYSSGMQVRLGFAVATALKPDVLILDEILAVGDANFQIKCLTRIGQQLKSSAVIFVGHQMERVAQICSRSLVLDKGGVAFAGDVTRGIEEYNRFGAESIARNTTLDKGINLKRLTTSNRSLAYGGKFDLCMEFESDRSEECLVRIVFLSKRDEILAEWNSQTHGITYTIKQGSNSLACAVSQVLLRPGRYRTNALLQPLGSSAYLIVANACFDLQVEHQSYGCYPVQF